ncbi:MAG TPA: DUF58 domain-containing protein [Ktedonosporobacter sp.]|jgi:uncharacterized protein (DUF58 family)|nr:DUF58 domain-containing protein [Ktedonosporobacter sp.]
MRFSLSRRIPASSQASGSGRSLNRRWYFLCIVLLGIGIPLQQPLFEVSGILLLIALGTTDIWARYCLNDLRFQRSLSEKQVLFGEEITLSHSVENGKLLPLPWLEIDDSIPSTLTIKGQKVYTTMINNQTMLSSLFSLRWYERVTRRYTVQCYRRGVYAFGPTTLRSGDIFGFIERQARFNTLQYLLVYPLVAPLTSFGLPARHPFGERRAPRRLLEDPSRTIGVREYTYGDSLRRIHWKATARTMQLQSKVYEPTTTYTMAIFLNIIVRLDAHYGINPDIQELSISAAASVSGWAIDQGYAVGLYANTIMSMPDEDILFARQEVDSPTLSARIQAQLKRRRIHLPPSSSPEQRKRIMEALARTQSYFGSGIEDVIQAEHTRLPVGSTIVIITGSLGEQLVDALTQLQRRGHSLAILFVGSTPPPIKLAGIAIYHLGGNETWQRLMASYSKSEDADHPKQTMEAIAEFRL